MKKFNKIVAVDNTKIQDWAIEKLQQHSESRIEIYTDYPETKQEILDRVGDAEAILVSWHTQITEEIIVFA